MPTGLFWSGKGLSQFFFNFKSFCHFINDIILEHIFLAPELLVLL